jgi:hypothetical protein
VIYIRLASVRVARAKPQIASAVFTLLLRSRALDSISILMIQYSQAVVASATIKTSKTTEVTKEGTA